VVCSNNDSIWHRFQDITTFTVYMTGGDLEKPFVFEKSWNYKPRALSIRVYKHIVRNTRCIFRGRQKGSK